MKIIDTHVHLGVSRFSGETSTENEILESMENHGITASLVMSQPTLEDATQVHWHIAEMCKKHPRKIFGIALIDPWLDEEEFRKQFERCIVDYGFVAFKLNPMDHNISPASPMCNKIYELASIHDIPVLVHTGLGTLNALPSLVIDPAKRYPTVKFILSHAGFAVYTAEAIVAAKCFKNIFLEPSWCPTFMVKSMVQEVGIDRLMIGSDHIQNIPVELVKWNSIGLLDSQLNQVMFENPNKIFKLNL